MKNKVKKQLIAAISDVEDLNTGHNNTKEIKELENKLEFCPNDLLAPRPSHTVCKGDYNRFIH